MVLPARFYLLAAFLSPGLHAGSASFVM